MVVMWIKGENRPENISGNEDFARFLNERLGSEAAQYFRDALKDERERVKEEVEENPSRFCTGECDRLYKRDEYYQHIINDLLDGLREIYKDHAALKRPHNLKAIADLINKIERDIL